MSDPPSRAEPRPPSFADAFRFWLKLGFISFGGPAGQIAILHREVVERKRWIGEGRFLHALNYCMLLPGPEAMQLATYIGWFFHRARGGIVAGALFVLPSVFILLALSYIYAVWGKVPAVAAALSGMKPVVVAIVLEAVFRIGRRAFRSRAHGALALLAFVSIYFLAVPFPLIVLGAGVAGLLVRRWLPGALAQEAADDDRTPPPPHTRPSRGRFLRTLLLGLLLWALPFAALIAWRGRESLHAREYLFFTQAALVTFGGAYAVLAYVTQLLTGEGYGWVTGSEAIDGLALAETTPGPLIMVLQFLGFMASHRAPEGLSPAASATVGALVTTYTTFLPSFLFIFLGAPYIERLRGSRRLSAALSGITAAVVGVILNLALVFGAQALRRPGPEGGFDWLGGALTLAALTALFHFKVPVAWVVLAGGALGWARMLLGG